MRITIDSMTVYVSNLDLYISHVKSILSTTCPSILRLSTYDIDPFIQALLIFTGDQILEI